jgi:phage terminase large subunit
VLQYKQIRGSLQDKFQHSRAKIQVFGGGFANGKTTAAVIKALKLAKDYPGSNGLIARSTYPKLNDTIRKEFLKWCPDSWIKRKALSQDNMVELENGTVVNFRYVQQQGKTGEGSSSNLLSATYDWIVIDQMEDPEITEKDFLDLLGRLRGSARYEGDDPTMPRSGPRWLIVLINPTRNWVFRKIIKPLQDFEAGIMNPDLLVDAETGMPIAELFEGSTYTNADNLPEDYIKGLEAAYKGQMRQRYLLGEWGAFEGLVYPQYSPVVHLLPQDQIIDYFARQVREGLRPEVIEAYDHGIAVPACYGIGFSDSFGNAFLMGGFYEAELSPEKIATRIKDHRKEIASEIGFGADFRPVLADPAIFRRGPGSGQTVGITVAGLLREYQVSCTRANNNIVSGIAKVQSYLEVDPRHPHPITGELGAPHFYVSSDLHWWDNEIVDYYWKKDTAGEIQDVPMDRRDHAMDMTKYFFTNRPRIALFDRRVLNPVKPPYMRWGEINLNATDSRRHRYGSRI